MRRALITGVSGQDGSYLAEHLLSKGYTVSGIVRRASYFNRSRIETIRKKNPENFNLLYGDITDSSNINRILEKIQPDEIYNLAAQSHVQVSFEVPEYTADVDGIGTLRLLDAIRETGIQTRFYQASTSELYGKVQEVPQTEQTPFYPRSPYAVAKLYAYWIVKNYREAYDIHASNGILFNHESPRRGENFVTRKITLGVTDIIAGKKTCLYMGNLDSKRDWGFAPDYVDAMWRIVQHKTGDDYVVATGETHTVREFIEKSFAFFDVSIEWRGEGIDEVGVDKASQKTVIKINPKYFRPTEVDLLLGNPEKAKQNLGWEPKVTFKELVRIMITEDWKRHSSERVEHLESCS